MIDTPVSPEQFYTAVGARVRAIREERGFSQRDLAERLDLNREAITRLEAGQNATIAFLARVSVELNVDPVRFFEGIHVSSELGEGLATRSRPRGHR